MGLNAYCTPQRILDTLTDLGAYSVPSWHTVEEVMNLIDAPKARTYQALYRMEKKGLLVGTPFAPRQIKKWRLA